MEEHERATVIIIGGAIAGTVFALQLLSHPTLRSKYRPIIFDSAPNLPGLRISNNVISSDSVGQSGAAVALTKQAIRLLQHLELGSELEAIAQDTEVIEIYRQPLLGLQDGSQSGVRVMEMSEPSGKSLFGGFWAIERGLLQALLVKNVLARGGEVIANKKLQQIIELDTLESAEKNRNELVKALFSDGTSYCGHLLVGADGAWSTVRRHLYTTKSAVGENVVDEGWKPDFQDLQIVYGLSKADTTDTRPIMYSMGLVGGGVGSWSLKNNRQMWHIYEAPCIAPPNTTQSRALSFEADKMLGEKWNAQVTTGGYDQTSTEALLDKHRTVWHPSAGTFGNLFDASETIVRVGLWHKVFTRLGNVRWDPKEKRPKECGKDMGVAGGRGNIVLIGDAAKVLMPTAGQGAAFAIEDATVLADSILNNPPSSFSTSFSTSSLDFSEAIKDYTRQRLPRYIKISKFALVGARLGIGRTWPERFLRDWVLGWLPQPRSTVQAQKEGRKKTWWERLFDDEWLTEAEFEVSLRREDR